VDYCTVHHSTTRDNPVLYPYIAAEMFLCNYVQLLVQILNPDRKRADHSAAWSSVTDMNAWSSPLPLHSHLLVRCFDPGINCPFPFTNKTCIHTIQPTQIANYHLVKPEYTSLMKQQFLIAHTIHQNEMLALLSRQLGYQYIFSQKDMYMKKFLVLTVS
jgi:hypothetical protein